MSHRSPNLNEVYVLINRLGCRPISFRDRSVPPIRCFLLRSADVARAASVARSRRITSRRSLLASSSRECARVRDESGSSAQPDTPGARAATAEREKRAQASGGDAPASPGTSVEEGGERETERSARARRRPPSSGRQTRRKPLDLGLVSSPLPHLIGKHGHGRVGARERDETRHWSGLRWLTTARGLLCVTVCASGS